MLTKRNTFLVLGLLLGFSFIVDSIVALRMSLTTDENQHVRYGVRVLQGQPDRGYTFDSQMPISALNAIPRVMASYLETHQKFPRLYAVLHDFRTERFPTIFASLALALMVFLWARDLYGVEAGLAACLLCSLSPNLIAHGSVATTDMYHALGAVGSLYFFRQYLLQPTWQHALLSGLTLALAQITKPFAIFLYAVVGLALAIALLRRRFDSSISLTPKRAFLFVALAAASFIATINVIYSFDRTFTTFGGYHFESTLFTRFQRTPFRRQIPVPVPYPFLQGLDKSKHNEQTGESFGNVYLLGHLRYAKDETFHGFKSYYAVALFYKEPIALEILFLIGLCWIYKNRKLDDILVGEGLLLAAATLLVFWLSFFDRAQIGIRHILPALAVETVIAGAAFASFTSKARSHKIILSLLVLWLALSAASYYPHMIPYFNEWDYDRKLSYKILGDSNLDWGQDAAIVKQFLDHNPDVILDPKEPVAGRILIRANRLTGVDRWNPPATFLTDRYQPVAQIGYAHFLFVVPAEDIHSTSH